MAGAPRVQRKSFSSKVTNAINGWPEAFYQGADKGKRLRVTGTVIKRDDLPVFVQKAGEPPQAGMAVKSQEELERIAELVAKGCTNHEVASRLFFSPKTVEWNLSKIYRKLHVRSRTELAAKLAKGNRSRAIPGIPPG